MLAGARSLHRSASRQIKFLLFCKSLLSTRTYHVYKSNQTKEVKSASCFCLSLVGYVRVDRSDLRNNRQEQYLSSDKCMRRSVYIRLIFTFVCGAYRMNSKVRFAKEKHGEIYAPSSPSVFYNNICAHPKRINAEAYIRFAIWGYGSRSVQKN
jgi:hypothetical protein